MLKNQRLVKLLGASFLLVLLITACSTPQTIVKAPEPAQELLRLGSLTSGQDLQMIAPHMAMPAEQVEEQLKLRQEKLQLQTTQKPLLMAHYYPWFQTPDIHGYWGAHWKMNTCNPDTIKPNGQRDICSHYYPMIGPYDSLDPDLLEYHILLMKLSGIDGIIVDWYGVQPYYDWPVLKEATDTIMNAFNDAGMKVAIMYIDQTVKVAFDNGLITDSLAAAQADLEYAEANYMSLENYVHIHNEPLLLNFGPSYFATAQDWQAIYQGMNSQPDFASLGYVDGFSHTTFPWIERPEWQNYLPNYYAWVNWKGFDTAIGSAYQRFHDYYAEGGWGTSPYQLNDLNGQRFSQYLNLNAQNQADMIQLATWNGFVEGTMLEPTLQTGYQNLLDLQAFTGVNYTLDDLELVTEIYTLRKAVGNNRSLQASVNTVSSALKQGKNLDASRVMTVLKSEQKGK